MRHLPLVATLLSMAGLALAAPAALAAESRPMAVSCSVLLPPAPVAGLPGTMRLVEKLTVPAGSNGHRHKHDVVEVLTVLSGSGHLTVDGRPEMALAPGTVTEVPPHLVHQLHNASDAEPLIFTATFIGKAGAHILTSYVGEKDQPAGCPHRLRRAG